MNRAEHMFSATSPLALQGNASLSYCQYLDKNTCGRQRDSFFRCARDIGLAEHHLLPAHISPCMPTKKRAGVKPWFMLSDTRLVHKIFILLVVERIVLFGPRLSRVAWHGISWLDPCLKANNATRRWLTTSSCVERGYWQPRNELHQYISFYAIVVPEILKPVPKAWSFREALRWTVSPSLVCCYQVVTVGSFR